MLYEYNNILYLEDTQREAGGSLGVYSLSRETDLHRVSRQYGSLFDVLQATVSRVTDDE